MATLDEAQFKRLEKAGRYFAERTCVKGVQPAQDPAAVVSLDPTKVQQLLDERQWLDRQLIEHQGHLNAAKDDSPPSSVDFEALQININDLQKELIEAQTDVSLKDAIIQRLQLSSTLSSSLFPAGGFGEEMPEQERVRKRLTELLEKQAELGSAILRIHKEIEEITPELEVAKQENLGLLKENRELMVKVKQAKEAQVNTTPRRDDRKLKHAQEKYDQTLSKIKMVRHVFQALILGSGINWGADEDTTNLMVSLGMPLDKQLEKL